MIMFYKAMIKRGVFMFEQKVDRTGTNAVKIDDAIKETGSIDVIAMSVADMDFRTSPAVVSRLINLSNHGIYGYTGLSDSYCQTVSDWVLKQYRYQIEQDWIVFTPRIIQAISMIVQTETEEGDGIGVMTPLYSPITNAVIANERKVVASALVYRDKSYEIDFEDLERVFQSGIKLFILVSPHNPTGRVFRKEEVKGIVDLCQKYGVKLISDEVHADFIWESTFTSVGQYFEAFDQVYVCVSPSKTFNIPGVEISNIIIPNQALRARYQNQLERLGFHNPNFFAEAALQAAYRESDEWFNLMKSYVRANRNDTIDFFNEKLTDFDVVKAEGTYLLWIGYQRTGLSEDEIKDWLVNEAKITASLGSGFGEDGVGFFRINVGMPMEHLEEALERMYHTYQKISKK